MSSGAGSSSSRVAVGAAALVGVWVVFFWLTPAPGGDAGEERVRISFGEAPAEVGGVGADAGPDASAGEAGGAADPSERAGPDETGGDESRAGEPVLREVTEEELAELAGPEDGGAVAGMDGEGGEAAGVEAPVFRVYTTRQGDTLQRISRRFYGTTRHWRAISRANGYALDPNRLGPGREILIPVDPENVQGAPADGAGDEEREPEQEWTEYVVSRGDTLSEIAKALYGRASDWRRIASANPGVDPSRLRVGTVLRIPPPE